MKECKDEAAIKAVNASIVALKEIFPKSREAGCRKQKKNDKEIN